MTDRAARLAGFGPRRPRASRGLAVLCLVTGLATSPAFAHGGEDHGQDSPPIAPAAVARPASPTAPAASGAAALEAPARLPDGSVFMPKAVQRLLGLRTQPVARGEVGAGVELAGRVVAEPGSGGRVQALQPGTLLPVSGKPFPALGQRVRRGEVVAMLQPAASSLERGDRLAQQAEVAGQLAIAQRRVARLEQLEGSVPAREIEAARLEFAALQRRQAALGAALQAPQPLVSPVDGVVSAVNATAGEVVDARALLFEVVDPARLAVEAPAYDLDLPARLVSAQGRVGDTVLPLVPLPTGRLLREQALPLRFRVTASPVPLAVGQPVRVVVRTRDAKPGTAVPVDALARDAAGQPLVWVHTAPERFEPRRVRVEPLDAQHLAVREGLTTGERVVVSGAALLSQLR